MLCKTEGSSTHRQLEMQAKCAAYMIEHCPEDLEKAEMLQCVKDMAKKVEDREFER
jgi:hypothetical protein